MMAGVEMVVTLAIPDLAGPEALARTLASIRRHTPESHQVEILSGGPGAEPFSAPAALNRLVAATSEPYVLLLEGGSVVTAGWLGRLLKPFDDPTIGLSGPSTNQAWNE